MVILWWFEFMREGILCAPLPPTWTLLGWDQGTNLTMCIYGIQLPTKVVGGGNADVLVPFQNHTTFSLFPMKYLMSIDKKYMQMYFFISSKVLSPVRLV